MKQKDVGSWPLEVQSGSVIVKIYRITNKGRRSFMVSYFSEGKRKQKMFADFDEAYHEAKAAAKDVNNGDLNALNLPSSQRVTCIHAMQALEPTGVALDLAAREYAAAWALLGGAGSLVEAAREYAKRNLHRLPTKLVPDAVEEMLEAKQKEGASEEYLKILRVYLNKFSVAFKSPLRSLTTGDVADFLRNMSGSPRSKNNARQTLGALFKFGKERGWLPRDHDGIGLVPKFKQKAGAIEIFTPWELVQFLNHVRDELVPFVAIGAFAGLRHAEIERLDWSEVRLADRFIEVTAAKAKTASRRLVPITDNLAKWLTPHVKKTGTVVPFENVNKQLGWLVRDTNKGLKAEAKAAGRNPKDAPQLRWKKNGLRHSFISYRLADIQSAAQVALEAGNSPQIIFQHYRELVRPKDAKSWFSITPGEDGKILYIDASKDSEQAATAAEKVAGTRQPAKAVAVSAAVA